MMFSQKIISTKLIKQLSSIFMLATFFTATSVNCVSLIDPKANSALAAALGLHGAPDPLNVQVVALVNDDQSNGSTSSPDMVTICSDELTNAEKNRMFNMYSDVYEPIGLKYWQTAEDFFGRYPCVLTHRNRHLEYFVMFQLRKNFNKISVIAHNGTRESKGSVMAMIRGVLQKPGYMLEASEGVSWVLRKQKTPMITKISDIEKALEYTCIVKGNAGFDADSKTTVQHYTRYCDGVEGVVVEKNFIPEDAKGSSKTLFGTAPCDFEEMDMDYGSSRLDKNGSNTKTLCDFEEMSMDYGSRFACARVCKSSDWRRARILPVHGLSSRETCFFADNE